MLNTAHPPAGDPVTGDLLRGAGEDDPGGEAASDPMSAWPCRVDELRTLFLFDKLSEDQLALLCREGWREQVEPGPVFGEGEPADRFYVLLDGEVALSPPRRSRRCRDEPHRTAWCIRRSDAGLPR